MGLGNIGLAVAKYSSKHYPTIGYDTKQQAVERALNNNIKASTTPYPASVYVVAVNTYYRNNAPDMSAIDDCCKTISNLNSEALVCFESTLQVGTARRMAKKHGLEYIAVCPHRWWEEDQVNYGVKQLRVLAALNNESLKRAKAFYNTLKIPLHYVSNLEIAEATKIAENAHRYVQIAFVEELKLIATENGLDFDEWQRAINTKWNVDLPEARDGIGKECLPKDTAFLASLFSEAELLKGAIKTNSNYMHCLAKKLKDTQKAIHTQREINANYQCSGSMVNL